MNKNLSFKSSYGWINLEEDKLKVTSISFGKKKNNGFSLELICLKRELIKYFKKKSKNIKCNYLLEGTDLQKKIWKELQKIPYGKTKSYKYIANKVKTSPRYVGNVCGQNKLLLLIPCHRVVRSDGKLGGFSGFGGIKLKKNLLLLENN